MLLQLILNQPQALSMVVKQTPVWVWGLLAGLMALGLSQVRDRTASLVRISIIPVAMTGFSIWGTYSAFGSSAQIGTVLAVWLATAIGVFALVAPGDSGARYDAATRSYALPGSWVPLALILGIFMTKYVVGVELAMQPALPQDSQFALTVSALYGVFNGFFAGRAGRLWRLALRPGTPAIATA